MELLPESLGHQILSGRVFETDRKSRLFSMWTAETKRGAAAQGRDNGSRGFGQKEGPAGGTRRPVSQSLTQTKPHQHN